MRKSLDELRDVDDPAIHTVQEWIDNSDRDVQINRPDQVAAEHSLELVGVSRRATLGSVIFDFGAVTVDGWVRLLGASHGDVGRSIDGWNKISAVGMAPQRLPRRLLVADDVVGGFFAISDGTLDKSKPGTICYYSPGSLTWVSLRMGYTAFLSWILRGSFPEWRDKYTWEGWETEVSRVRFDQGISIYPYLFARGPNIAARSRRPIPIDELWDLYAVSFPKQLGREG